MSTATATDAFHLLATDYLERFPAEAAAELERATGNEVVACVTDLAPTVGAALLGALTPVTAGQALGKLEAAVVAPLLAALEPPRAAALLTRLDSETRAAHLRHMKKTVAEELTALTQYPRNTAGSLMDAQVMAFLPEMKVSEVLDKLWLLPLKKAVEVFLVDQRGALVGAVPLQSLLIASPDQPMRELTGPPPVAVPAMARRDEVVDALSGERLAQPARRQLAGFSDRLPIAPASRHPTVSRLLH